MPRLRLAFILFNLFALLSTAVALEVIVDNSDPGCAVVGAWNSSTTGCYGPNLFSHAPGSGSETATWTAALPAGWYRVDYYVGANTDAATDAHYTIVHRDGTDSPVVSQRKGTAGWYFLGTHYFSAGASVTLSDLYVDGTRVIADAVRFRSIFSFVQMSDSHVGYGEGTIDTTAVANELAALGKVTMAGYGFDAPPPSFAIHSGDTTEFGAEYYGTLTGILSLIPFPVYLVQGNHDATWNCMREKVRTRHGAPLYTFDFDDHGTRHHFVMMDSPIIQSPRAGFTREALDWLKTDLAALPANTRVFLNFHHPITGASDPKRYDTYRLLEVIRPFNVLIGFYGHGHGFNSSLFDGLRVVQGGCTYNTGGEGGYNIVTVTHDRIHVAKKVVGEATAATGILDSMAIPSAPTYPSISVSYPTWEFVQTVSPMSVTANISGAPGTVSAAAYELNDSGVWQALAGSGTGPYTASQDVSTLVHGRHWLRVRFTMSGGQVYHKMVPFWVFIGDPKPRWIHDLGTASLSAPAVANGKVYVGTHGGSMRCIHARYGNELWRMELPGDVVSSPEVNSGRVYFGCSDGNAYCLDAETGALVWATPLGGPVYSPPTVAGQDVYIGANGTGEVNSSGLFSLDAATGVLNWKYTTSNTIESKPFVLNDVVYAGSWDNYLHAVYTADGSNKWRYRRNSSRYYAPADSWPVASAIANRVFVADREYYMNAVNLDTGIADWTATGISSQALTPDGTGLLQRGYTSNNLDRTTFDNVNVWSSPCSLDSAPVSPVTNGTRAAVVDQDGLASVVNVATGAIEYQAQVARGYQLSPLALDSDGTIYASTYDGFLVCMSNQPLPAATGPELALEVRNAAGTLTPNPPYSESPSTGSWADSTAKAACALLQGSGSRFNGYTNGSIGTARMTPNIPTEGQYDLYAAWNTSSNARNVSYVVRHRDAMTVVTRDQKPGGALGGSNTNVWNHLGRFNFAVGQNQQYGSVLLDETTVTGPVDAYNTGRTYADGFLWAYAGPLSRNHATLKQDDLFTTNITNPVPGGTTGWTAFSSYQAGQVTDYDAGNTALRVTISSTASPQWRVNGWMTANSEWLPYTAVGTGNCVRGKFCVFSSGQADPANHNQVPNMRLRLANRFAVVSLLEVFNHLGGDTVSTNAGRDLRPSTSAASPSIYRVDFDPVDVSALNTAGEGVMRGFEAYAQEPQENGSIELAESAISVYPASFLPVTGPAVRYQKIMQTSASDAGELGVFNAATDGPFLRKFKLASPGVVAYDLPLDGVTDPTYTQSAAGITLDTRQVTTDVLGLVTREFTELGANTARARVESDRQYKIRWHVTSSANANTNAQMRLRARSLKFAWSQKLEVGGARSAGTLNNTIARQALPGVGSGNPDQLVPGETGGWYTMLMQSPMSTDIQPSQPYIAAQPGPGDAADSIRDIKFGFDLVDSPGGAPISREELGRITLDRIEIYAHDMVLD